MEVPPVSRHIACLQCPQRAPAREGLGKRGSSMIFTDHVATNIHKNPTQSTLWFLNSQIQKRKYNILISPIPMHIVIVIIINLEASTRKNREKGANSTPSGVTQVSENPKTAQSRRLHEASTSPLENRKSGIEKAKSSSFGLFWEGAMCYFSGDLNKTSRLWNYLKVMIEYYHNQFQEFGDTNSPILFPMS